MQFFEERRSQEAVFQLKSSWEESGLIIDALEITGRRDQKKGKSEVVFQAYCSRPKNINGTLPAFVITSGLHTGREAIRIVAKRPEFAGLGVITTLDYPYSGPTELSVSEIFPYIPTIRQALFDGVEAVRLAIDYLEKLDYVDSRRIVLLGVSLGSFYAVDTGGVDQRPAAVISFMGGGGLSSLIDWNLRRGGHISSRFLSSLAASVAVKLIKPLEPLRLVGRISPRPYIQVSAKNDEMVPEENALALFAASGEPNNLIWIPTEHVMPGMESLIERLIHLAYGELVRCKIL